MWYRSKDDLINFNLCGYVQIEDYRYSDVVTQYRIIYYFSTHKINDEYDTKEERDAEFEKICKLLGLEEKEHISRCC